MNSDEANLIENLRRGDEAALNEIYRRCRNRVYGFAYRMTFDRALAEDITHETFLVLIERPARFSVNRGSLTTFLCAVARNLVMNHLRRKHNSEVELDETDGFDPADDAQRNNPLADLLKRELSARVNACIAALPPLQREVIVLREFEELSYEEIARVVEADAGAVKARLHRARQNLARQLAAYVAPGKEKCYELH